ncbi:BA75_04801T0 [Komagataella pastoris]|uniref:BA75_04801T0 n=1 Tax=Komagataella pastoris TaxID=4922 RepID=A0A1B2JJF1_PICPA|nr:BA75_04801T0 [Komagataella pastoris]
MNRSSSTNAFLNAHPDNLLISSDRRSTRTTSFISISDIEALHEGNGDESQSNSSAGTSSIPSFSRDVSRRRSSNFIRTLKSKKLLNAIKDQDIQEEEQASSPSSDDVLLPHDITTYTISNKFPLPVEILNTIIENVYYNSVENVQSITSNLEEFSKSIVPVCKMFKILSSRLLYRYSVFTRSNSFDKFLKNLNKDHFLGLNVEFLDFMEFTSIGLGRTGRMNEEIQMVTSSTILNCLQLTPNLIEFLGSESIEGDIDKRILSQLFNNLLYLAAIDFCGSTGDNFVNAFKEFTINRDVIPNITKIGFHDCIELPLQVFQTFMPALVNLTRLDLTHTQITGRFLSDNLPPSARLTHLSLSRCNQITAVELMDFLLYHESITNGSLKWLSLQCDSSIVSILNEHQLSHLLNNINAPNLMYLNLGGYSVKKKHLDIIKNKFINLKSLILAHSQLTIDELYEYLSPKHKQTNSRFFIQGLDQYTHNYPTETEEETDEANESDEPEQQLKFIDLTGNKNVTRWSIDNPKILNASTSLLAIELDQTIVEDIGYGPEGKLTMNQDIWKTYDSQGRRSWLFKLSPEEVERERRGDHVDYYNTLTYYDTKTGKKHTKKAKPPFFLRFAAKKINLSIGPFATLYEDEKVFPVDFSERGIYKYYSLNR